MTFVSYAQNFEDVILWRALRHIKHGFYIDVGAQDPIKDSVSLGFYEKGWRGAHIEANPFYAKCLRMNRPDEDVIEVACGSEEGKIAFFEISGTGLSTGDATIALEHASHGRQVREIAVDCIPISSVLERYAGRDIHWLKIDVEGMEEAVIDGWLPAKTRPWIVVVESTVPGTQRQSSEKWEPKILALGYDFVYFDGLNRFFVSHEQQELKLAFGPGPNVFDSFRLADTSDFVVQDENTGHSKIASAERQARHALEQELGSERQTRVALERQLLGERRARAMIESQLAEAALAKDLNLALAQQLDALTNSRAWRLTAPLRVTADAAKEVGSGIFSWLTFRPGTRPRRVAVHLVAKLGYLVLENPELSRRIRSIVRMLPRPVQARLRSIVLGGGGRVPTSPSVPRTEVSEISGHAKAIYSIILAAKNGRKEL